MCGEGGKSGGAGGGGHEVVHLRSAGGLAWQAPELSGLLRRAESDGPDHLERSVLEVLEDGRPLGPAHAHHHIIRKFGGGRFSHWAGAVLLSTSDNSNPLTNGRRYCLRLGETVIELDFAPDVRAQA